ncbi:Na+/H+ antiporter NhaC family protein [Georgenia thermotolerans]|uniref:Na+/H+ antiporter NhaC family protein n=2 Tax=Georgenia thermotolerans TaxID=527326 RepID=A0A7J5UKV6_9MICO|nr:Na+/H+ antiporter NhaC family protein [Georgenia thermotolerans]
MVLLTRKVLRSLAVGIVSAALVVSDLDPVATVRLVWDTFVGLFWVDGVVNTWNVYIVLFLLLLGVLAAFIMMSGGSYAFGRWAMRRVRTRRGSQLVALVLGVVIFIDDYFNALAVGQIAKPLTDRNRVSRAKLSYLIDSTSAPVCVVAPFSSWGASIMGIIAPILLAAGVSDVSPFAAFMAMVPLNYYVWAALALVLLVALLGVDVGPMRREETRAVRTGEPYAPGTTIAGELDDKLPAHRPGSVGSLIGPFLGLVLGVVGAIVWTGHAASGSWNLVEIFAATLVTESLLFGGVVGVVVALAFYFRDTRSNERFGLGTFRDGWVHGASSMLPAVYILLMAWMTAALIEDLGTGAYLAGLVAAASLDPTWLVPLVFVVAGVMAFATGTSWGSFGILLPIAGQIVTEVGATELLLPALAAVLAGAVLGDHCSPISDTTILSATGAGANLMDHVVTQLPYALTGALAALGGYVVLALTTNTWLGLITTLVLVTAVALAARAARGTVTAEDALEPAAV